MENQNNWIIDIINNNDNYGLFISNIDYNNLHLGDLEKIKYDHIKYKGEYKIFNNKINKNISAHYFSFNKKVFDLDFLEEVCTEINKILLNENKSIQSAFEKIIEYFSKSKFIKDIRKRIYGDIAEALFMIEGKNILDIDFKNNLRLIDEELYDFKYGDTFLEVKAATKKNNEFIISIRQLEEAKNKKIIIVKFICIRDAKTILDLYDLLEPLPDLLKTKKKKWIDINANSENDILNTYTVDLENIRVHLFIDENLPEIIVKKWGAMKDASITINATDSSLKKLEELKNYLTVKSN